MLLTGWTTAGQDSEELVDVGWPSVWVFKSLQALEVDEYPDVKFEYSITFTFSRNSYFENIFLAKSFHLLEEGLTTVKDSDIKWKHGMTCDFFVPI
ncbi:hypothetical protein L7F22_033096 [Adiantum nelumboides]|nr:hypothetical protein [Adiantum nelumboides]